MPYLNTPPPPRITMYYRAPEGEDLLGKLWYTGKYTGALGISFALLDTQLYTKPKGFMQNLARYLYWTVPLVGMSTAFVVTTYIATNLRKKDDRLNYALGGFAAGSIYGTWRRSFGLGVGMGLFLAIVGVIKKDYKLRGELFLPTIVVREFQGTYHQKCDFTLTKEYPGNWVRGD